MLEYGGHFLDCLLVDVVTSATDVAHDGIMRGWKK
jgi:hypothetical protein